MSLIRSKDSIPEKKLRSLVHGMGYRYRLHVKSLPGKPDLVFPSKKAIIFMHGCFWHRHENCRFARLPKSRIDFWKTKLEANKERDKRTQDQLKNMGWRVLVIWECEMSDSDRVSEIVRNFLDNKDAINEVD